MSKTGDPNAAISYSLGNGGPTAGPAQRSWTAASRSWSGSASCPVTDPDIQASLAVIDKQISVSTPSGTGYYRYGDRPPTEAPTGTATATSRARTPARSPGAPWPPTDTGTGHLWPVLSGERGRVRSSPKATTSGAKSLLHA